MRYKLIPNPSDRCCDCALYKDQENPLCNKYHQAYPNCLKNRGRDSYMYVIVKCELPKDIKVI